MFIDDLADYLTKWMASYSDIIICGDFNKHIDDLIDIEAQIFSDTMEALELQQHVNFETHCAGNILDLLFTEIASQLTMRTFKGRYISDHRAIVIEFDIRVQHTLSRSVTFRNLKKINVSEFQSSLNFSNINNLDDLQSVYNKYQNELTRLINWVAPERTKLLANQEKRPWVWSGHSLLKEGIKEIQKDLIEI